MNAPLAPIDLAREADFALGPALVRPALRLFATNGADESVEPRVMQVLVALARRAGDVVGRDELVTTCWEGRVIGEDAIQRAIAKVRKLGETSGAFAVETIPKVGYRLKVRVAAADAHVSQAPPDGPAAASAAHEARPSLAILPFSSRSGFEEDDAFASDVVEDLAAALSSSPWPKIIATSTTAIYRQGARDLRQIGRDLGARYLLEGNVRRAGHDLRVVAQLVEAESGNIIWTQKFDCPLAELSSGHDQIVAEIAAHLDVQVQRAESAHALKQRVRANAWDALVGSWGNASKGTRAALEAAAEDAKRAVEINPNYADAYAMLAALQSQIFHFRGGDDPEFARAIFDNVRRAEALDPDNPHVVAGIAHALVRMGELQAALDAAKRAVAMHPNLESARLALGQVLARLGRSDEAIIELETADRLAPNSFWASGSAVSRSVAHLQSGRLQQALEAADQALMSPSRPESLIQSMLCLAKADGWDRARQAMRRLQDIDPDTTWRLVEYLVRDLHGGASAVDDYVAIVRQLWDEAAPGAESA